MNEQIKHYIDIPEPIKNNSKVNVLEKEQVERWGKNATEDLSDLGLGWDDLKNRSTLDVGAGQALIGESAKLRNIEVVSLDNNPESWVNEDKITIPDVHYIKSDAIKLPFHDESFNFVISHAGPFVNTNSKENLIEMINEALRVLKYNGELRFGPGNLNANIFEDNELFSSSEERENLSTQECIQRIKEKSLQFLKNVNPNFEQIDNEITPSNENVCVGYYKLVKSNPEL